MFVKIKYENHNTDYYCSDTDQITINTDQIVSIDYSTITMSTGETYQLTGGSCRALMGLIDVKNCAK